MGEQNFLLTDLAEDVLSFLNYQFFTDEQPEEELLHNQHAKKQSHSIFAQYSLEVVI